MASGPSAEFAGNLSVDVGSPCSDSEGDNVLKVFDATDSERKACRGAGRP